MRKKINIFLVLQLLLGILCAIAYNFFGDIIPFYVIIAIITLFAIYTYYNLLGSIVKPIEKVCHDIDVASDNTWGACLDGSCEINLIDSAIHSFLQDKKEFVDYQEEMDKNFNTMKEIFATVAETNTLTNSLDNYILLSADGAHNQALTISTVVKSLEEMNIANLDINKSTSHASDLALQTKTKAESGNHSVKELFNAIEIVHKNAEFLRDDMSKLLKHAKSVNDIMNVITEIADQTNLLALNAAIEAARAGEAGRGFSVVADEVRKLAEKTMQSTTGVGDAIEAIQQSVEKSTEQVEATVKNVNVATELAKNCEFALYEIVQMAENSSDQVRSIATATEEQSASSEEIANIVTHINGIAMDNEASLEEAKRSVFFMQAEQKLLSELIEKIKVLYKHKL